MRHSAENQRRYRQQKKETDANYLQREMQRVAKYYVPTSQLSAADAEERRRKRRESMRRQRRKKLSVPLPTAVPPPATPPVRATPHATPPEPAMPPEPATPPVTISSCI